MLSESITDRRSEVIINLMDTLSTSIASLIETGKIDEASKLSDSLTFLIVKTYEVESFGKMADSASKIGRNITRHKHDLGDLE